MPHSDAADVLPDKNAVWGRMARIPYQQRGDHELQEVIAESLAGCPKSPALIAIKVVGAVYNADVPIPSLEVGRIKQYIDAVCGDDPALAAETYSEYEMAVSAATEALAEATAGQSPLGDEATAQEVYAATRKVVDILFDDPRVTTDHDTSLVSELVYIADRRHQHPSPYRDISPTGIYLDMDCGSPTQLITPWGLWDFHGFAPGMGLVKEAWMSRLKLSVASPAKDPFTAAKYCNTGPVYRIHAIDGVEVPFGSQPDNGPPLSVEQAEHQWAKFSGKSTDGPAEAVLG